MKTPPLLVFGAALSVGAILMLGLRGPARSQPEPARSVGVPLPYSREGASIPSMPPALIKRRQEQLRRFLEAHAVKDPKTQEALTSYFAELQRSRAQVFVTNRALLSTLRSEPDGKAQAQPDSKSATDAKMQEAVKAYQSAIKDYATSRSEGEKDLAKSLGQKWTPRMRALLIGMGAIGEASPIVPIWGAYSTASAPQVAAQEVKRVAALKKIQMANKDCCGIQKHSAGTAKVNKTRQKGARPESQPATAIMDLGKH